MGCQFPIPLLSKNKNNTKFSDKESESRPTFSDYYGKSICFGEDSETTSSIGRKRRKLIASKGVRSNIINAQFDILIRNQYGRVISSRVSSIIDIKAENPNLNAAEICEKYKQNTAENTPDFEDENVTQRNYIKTMRIDMLQTEEADLVRGYNDFISYKDLCLKPPSEIDEICIDKDLPRIIPDDVYYSSEYGEGRKILRRLLECISIYHEGSAYYNSIGFITAILLLYMDEEDTFWMINFLMESSIVKKWITQDRENI